VGLQREKELSMDAFAEQLGSHLGVADQDEFAAIHAD
jgi:hypothetical protein